MSTAQNADVVRQFLAEVLGEGDITRIEELVAADFVGHEGPPPGMPEGREGLKVLFPMLHSAFPDLAVSVDDMVAQDDRVVARMTWTGTQQGNWMGMPPSGKSMSIEVIDIFRVADGRIAEHWGLMDNMAMMQQLGAMGPE